MEKKQEFSPPRGMRDFYPEDMLLRNRLFSVWKETARLHGFEEYDAPVVETEELLVRKGGEEIVKQIYTFVDKSGRKLALRPEMTPSLARMVISQEQALSFPLKWFSIPQCFRYERMTMGRRREHYQWNLDIVGESSVMAEAEVISTAVDALVSLGLTETDFKVLTGSRFLLSDILASIGFDMMKFRQACLMLDKRGKIPDGEIRDLLKNEGVSPADIAKIFEIFEISTLEDAKKILLNKDAASLKNVVDFFEAIQAFEISGFVKFDLSIIRGLEYYTGIVFEAFDTQRKFRAIFGGGRYDNLLSALGGRELPSVGLGFGDVVVAEILNHLGLLNDEEASYVEAVVGYIRDEERNIAMHVANELRKMKISADLVINPQRPKKIFSRAQKKRAKWVIIAGPEEVKNNQVNVKNTATGEQKTLKISELCIEVVQK